MKPEGLGITVNNFLNNLGVMIRKDQKEEEKKSG